MNEDVTGLRRDLDKLLKLYTPEDILEKLKTLDGVGSGLDADLVDGINGPDILAYKGEIPSGANLNGYTTTGLYHQSENADASSGSNYPVPYAGMLEVTKPPSGGMIYQKYSVYYDFESIYVRSYYGWPSGQWSPWKKVAIGVGGWKLIDDHAISSGSPVSNYTLNVTADWSSYKVDFALWFNSNASSRMLTIRPNGVYTNYMVYGYSSSAALGQYTSNVGYLGGVNGNTTGWITGTWEMKNMWGIGFGSCTLVRSNGSDPVATYQTGFEVPIGGNGSVYSLYYALTAGTCYGSIKTYKYIE